jgi:hypothetical protein
MDGIPMSNPPTLPTTLRPRRRWLRVLAALLIFLGGMVCGGGLTVIVAVHNIRYAVRHPETVPPRIAKYLKRQLDLTPDQATQVEALIAQTQRHLQEIRRRNQPEVAMELANLRQQVGNILTVDQRDKWDAIFDQAVDRWLPPPPPDEPPATQPS